METNTDVCSTLTGSPNTTYVQVEPSCSYCGCCHEGTCPRVEEFEYYPNGTLKRVRLRAESPLGVVHQPDAASEIGHTCGVDCPEIIW